MLRVGEPSKSQAEYSTGQIKTPWLYNHEPKYTVSPLSATSIDTSIGLPSLIRGSLSPAPLTHRFISSDDLEVHTPQLRSEWDIGPKETGELQDP
jgi:hypothetical protein